MKKINHILLLSAVVIIVIFLAKSFTAQDIIVDQNQIEYNANGIDNVENIVFILDEKIKEPPLLEIENSIELIKNTAGLTQQSLIDFQYGSASVLPYCTLNGQKYFILSREAYGWASGVKGTYDDFGGKKEPEDTDPLISAAREFFEEAIIDKSLHLNFEETCNYIKENTLFIIANTTRRKKHKHVTYIIDFQEYKNEFFNNFYNARKLSTEHVNLEKDSIALVEQNNLIEAIKNSTDDKSTYVQAIVINPTSQHSKNKSIKLREYFIIKLRKFFLDMPYQEGENKKVRFYY